MSNGYGVPKKYMFVPMIVYCIEKSSKDCISVLDARYKDTK